MSDTMMKEIPRSLTRRDALRYVAHLAASALAADVLLLTSGCGNTPPNRATPSVTAGAVADTSLGDIYDVTTYGAKGDGTADDTDAIQATIDAVPPSGGVVLFPRGTYLVSPTRDKNLRIKSDLHFVGSGRNSTLKIKDGSGDWYRLFSPTTLDASVSNVTFEDLTFDANSDNNSSSLIMTKSATTWQIFIYITAGSNIHVRRCRFAPCSGIWAIALVGTNISDCSVTDCYFRFVMRDGNDDYDNSMVYVEATNYQISNNVFETDVIPGRGGRACIEAHGGPAVIRDNVSRGFRTGVNITNAYYAGGSLGDVICRDNTFSDALQGIALWPTEPNILANVSITGNTIELAQIRHGAAAASGIETIYADEATTLATRVTIATNTIRFQDEGAGRRGKFYVGTFGIGLLNLGGAESVIIDQNTVELCPAVGILIGNNQPGMRAFRDIHVTKNKVINPGQNVAFPEDYRSGIRCLSTISGLELADNTIADTYPVTRCTAAISFDRSRRSSYVNVQATNNAARAVTGPLKMLFPDDVENR